MHILVVDNHDSFTFNLVEYVRLLTGKAPTVVTQDTPWEPSLVAGVDAVIISPGPGNPADPADLGLSAAVIEHYDGPILGVCLGLQALVHLGGGRVERLGTPAHGITALVNHRGTGLFAGMTAPLRVVRYHSLHATEVPEDFEVTARLDNGVVMAIAHKRLPRWGVQFHPESMRSEEGLLLLSNFLDMARRFYAREYFCVRTLDHALDPAACAAGLSAPGKFWLEVGGKSVVGQSAEIFSWDCAADGPDFFSAFAARLGACAAPARVGAPIPGLDFALGWVGYLGYELGGHATSHDMAPAPGKDAELLFARRAVVIDPQADKSYLLSFAGDDSWQPTLGTLADAPAPGPARPVHARGAYLAAIATAQEYMAAGDSYEVCLTNRYELDPVADMLGAFVALRQRGATPRAGYLEFPDHSLASVTPELFLHVSDTGRVTSRPIKGTRPRGADAAHDAALRQELAGEKETAELLMVADMVRHDLSRVCDGVTHDAEFYVESYPHVNQLMVDISGQLRPQYEPLDAVAAAFPGGSMTGAPKDRTMANIGQLEGTWRGVYSGAFGFFSTTGAVDLSMTIRTLVSSERGAYYGVGGAILALSDPVAEWEETQVKLKPLKGLCAWKK